MIPLAAAFILGVGAVLVGRKNTPVVVPTAPMQSAPMPPSPYPVSPYPPMPAISVPAATGSAPVTTAGGGLPAAPAYPGTTAPPTPTGTGQMITDPTSGQQYSLSDLQALSAYQAALGFGGGPPDPNAVAAGTAELSRSQANALRNWGFQNPQAYAAWASSQPNYAQTAIPGINLSGYNFDLGQFV